MSAEDVLLRNLIRKMNELPRCGQFELDLQLVRNRNLFPAIHNIYIAPTEGTVVELGFQTENRPGQTGSGRRRRSMTSDKSPFT